MRVRGRVLGMGLPRRAHSLPTAAAMLLTAGFVAMFAGVGISTAVAAENMTEYFQQQGSSPLAIVAGAEGNLWYTGGLAPGGCLTGDVLFALPGGVTQIGVGCVGGAKAEAFAGSGANGITLGPDDNLWFTAGGGVGVIKPSATESEDFLLPPVETASDNKEPLPSTSLGGITAGPEHENLWFTEVENSTNKIDRINPTSDAITEFTLPPGNDLAGGAGGTSIVDIATGPKETLWFAEPGSHAIGVIDTTGNSSTRSHSRKRMTPRASPRDPKATCGSPTRTLLT